MLAEKGERIFDLAFVVCKSGIIHHFSATNQALLYTHPTAFLGKLIYEVLPAGTSERLHEMVQQVLLTDTAYTIEYELNIPSGKRQFQGFCSPLHPDVTGEKDRVLFVVKDITEITRQDIELKDARDRFQIIFETANSGIAFANGMGRIVDCNAAFEDLIGYSLEVLKGMSFAEFTHPDDQVNEKKLLENLALKKVNNYRIEKRYITASGNVIWVDVSVSAIRDDNGLPLFFVGVCNNITTRKEQEIQLRELNNTKDKLFSIIAHDLRNPLNAITGIAGLLVKSNVHSVPEDEKQKMLEMLLQASQNANVLLENLLQWARTQTNSITYFPQKTGIRLILEDVIYQVEAIAAAKNVRLVCEADEHPEAMFDFHMMSAVLRNLVTNSIKFSHEGSQVLLSASIVENELIFAVKDEGVGMSEEEINSLFNVEKTLLKPGTANERGTGLGLLICKEFVKHHNGTISICSTEGKGSTFTIRLPKV